jgi:hypothetical protein
LARTIAIAAVIGAWLAWWSRSGVRFWPAATLLALWPSLGGHFVEIWFLNWLRPRLPASRWAQVLARIAVWFAGGVALLAAMQATALALSLPYFPRLPAWWVGGAAFIGIELVAHLVLQLRGRNSFYNGCG